MCPSCHCYRTENLRPAIFSVVYFNRVKWDRLQIQLSPPPSAVIFVWVSTEVVPLIRISQVPSSNFGRGSASPSCRTLGCAVWYLETASFHIIRLYTVLICTVDTASLNVKPVRSVWLAVEKRSCMFLTFTLKQMNFYFPSRVLYTEMNAV
jgi:hypothetical protein